eukprot:TRINITY_DN1756_c0_g2_i2.p1 TRINITY_DN1756_c0_g2~~TRINITY_DN1756_c0_g2_i2.p1  ORF type:complete len:885 (+),score=241.38 TRINITY_DN1756_c0_g2_i2:41-2695(+)
MSSMKLRDLIREIRSCKTAAEERALVSREKAHIRNSFRDDEAPVRARNVAKLLFINMMGHDADFGQVECLKLITSNAFTDKRIGYLGLTQLFNEKSEVLMMSTNRLRVDLNSPILPVQSLSISALSEIATAEMCRELAPELLKLLTGGTSNYIRKKTCLALARVVRKVPDLAEEIAEKVANAMATEKHHGVVLSALGLINDMIGVQPKAAAKLRKLVNPFVALLKSTVGNYSAEYDVNGITDPFLQASIIRFFRQIAGPNETLDEVTDVLAQVAANTTSTKNTGNAVLYEAVKTIMAINSPQSLRALGINVLGKFLANKDNNSKYVSLSALSKVLRHDLAAVQKHKGIILECLAENDLSVKRQALDLLYLISNESNVKSIVKELLNALLTAEPEFAKDLAQKLCAVIEKHAPTRRWQIDSTVKVLTMAGNFVLDDNVSALVHLILATPQLQLYSVTKLYFSLRENINQEGLVRVGIWALGEYAQLLVGGSATGPDGLPIVVSETEVLDLFKRILSRMKVPDVTKELALTSLIKLYPKFPQLREDIRVLIESYTTSMSLEVQQRACEYAKIISQGWSLSPELNEPINPMAAATNSLNERPIGDLEIDEVPVISTGQTTNQTPGTTGTKTAAKPQTTSAGGLIDLDVILNAGPAPVQQTAPQTAPPKAVSELLDIFGGPAPPKSKPAEGLPIQIGAPTPAPAGSTNILELFDLPVGNVTTPQANSAGGSKDLLGLDIGVKSAPKTGGGFNFAGDLLGGGLQPAPSTTNGTMTLKAAEDDTLDVVMTLKKERPDVSLITTTFNNKTGSTVTDLVFQVAAQKHIKLQLNPMTSNRVAPLSRDVTNHTMIVTNTQQGVKGIVLKIRLTYNVDGRPGLIEKALSDIPPTF